MRPQSGGRAYMFPPPLPSQKSCMKPWINIVYLSPSSVLGNTSLRSVSLPYSIRVLASDALLLLSSRRQSSTVSVCVVCVCMCVCVCCVCVCGVCACVCVHRACMCVCEGGRCRKVRILIIVKCMSKVTIHQEIFRC